MKASPWMRVSRLSVPTLLIAVMILCPVRALGDILNPGFESLFDNWSGDQPANFGWQSRTDWVTEGDRNMTLWADATGTFAVGDRCRMYQTVDLTPFVEIQFDVNLVAQGSGSPPFDHFKAAVLIDSTEKWSADTGGAYLNNSFALGGLTGNHTLEFRIEAEDAGTYTPSYWTQWDNFRGVVPEPSTLSLLGLALTSVAIGRRRT